MSSWDTNAWINFCGPHWELIFHNKWHPGTSELSAPLEIAVEVQFHVHSTKTILVFLPADGEASWSLLPSSVSLLSGDTVHPLSQQPASKNWDPGKSPTLFENLLEGSIPPFLQQKGVLVPVFKNVGVRSISKNYDPLIFSLWLVKCLKNLLIIDLLITLRNVASCLISGQWFQVFSINCKSSDSFIW